MTIANARIRLGVSSCLLGNQVRYDGTHKYHARLMTVFAPYVDFVPLCPEVGIGMGVPRAAIQLVSRNGVIHALGVVEKSLDVSAPLRSYHQSPGLGLNTLSGFIFKKNSPSCGLYSPVVDELTGLTTALSPGLFAASLLASRPELPCIEESDLDDRGRLGSFITRVLAYHRDLNPC